MSEKIERFVEKVSTLSQATRGQPETIRHELAELMAAELRDKTGQEVSSRAENLGRRTFHILSGNTFRVVLLFKIARNVSSAGKNWLNRLNDFYHELGEAVTKWRDAYPVAIWALPAEWMTCANLDGLEDHIGKRRQRGEAMTLALLPTLAASDTGAEITNPFSLDRAIHDLVDRIDVPSAGIDTPIKSLDDLPIDELTIRDLRCFGRARISFRSDDGSPRMWTVIIGENNTGKSTLLQALALATTSQTSASSLAVSISGGRVETLVKQGGARAEIEVRSSQSRAQVRISGTELTSTPPTGLALRVLGYGPWRRLPEGTGLVRSSSSPPSSLDGLRSLFDPGTPLTDPEAWLKTQDYLMRSKEKNALDLARTALIKLLPDVEEIDVHPKGVTVRTQQGHRTPLRLMSDGYKAMTTLVVDIVARLAEGREVRKPEDIAAIVLIDELDLHLHPRWQLNVIKDLRELFPKIQFIVTTHSPLILLGALKGEVLRLRWAGDSVECTVAEDDPDLLRVDQVLYGIFGLTSVRGPAAQQKLVEIERLLQKKYGDGLSEGEESRLKTLRAYESTLPYFEDPSVTVGWIRDKLEELE